MLPRFRIGPSPHGTQLEQYGKDGTWHGRFSSAEDALRSLLPTFANPGITAGRLDDIFVDGVSLPGVPSSEVIQLWSTDPAIAQRSHEFGRRNRLSDLHPTWPGHMGNGEIAGLALEIRVQDIARYLSPVFNDRALPAGHSTESAVSPLAASLGDVLSLRSRAAIELSNSQLKIQKAQFQMEEARRSFEQQTKAIEAKLEIANAYLSGANELTWLVNGTRAPKSEPYVVYQSRIHLDTELGLLANLVDLDWRSVPQIDEWLVETGAWRKLLPANKAIIVSRIRSRDLRYEGISDLEAAWYNHFNRGTLVWVRDGESLARFASDIPVGKRLFPADGELDRLVGAAQAAIWQGYFQPRKENRSDKEKPGLVRHPEKAPIPYILARRPKPTFGRLEEWLVSPIYTQELDSLIRTTAAKALEDWSRKNLPFVVLLQGVVDRCNVLSVPPGTNLFDPVALGHHFHLVNDYGRGLPDQQSIRRWEAVVAQVSAGDLVIAPALRRRGNRYDNYIEENPEDLRFYRVTSIKDGSPLIRRAIPSKRYDGFTKRFEPAELKTTQLGTPSSFMPMKLPNDLIETLLHHREWKIEHEKILPILGQWASMRAQARSAANGTPLQLRRLHLDGLNYLQK